MIADAGCGVADTWGLWEGEQEFRKRLEKDVSRSQVADFDFSGILAPFCICANERRLKGGLDLEFKDEASGRAGPI